MSSRVGMYRVSGVWGYCVGLWEEVCRRFRDREVCEGSMEYEKVCMFRDEFRWYSREVCDGWLEEYGLVRRIVNRGKHKKFLEDGSWISNGVRFGG